MKRPAAAISESVDEKEDPAHPELSENNVTEHNQQDFEANYKLNICVRNSLKQLDTHIDKLEETKYKLEAISLKGRHQKLQSLAVEELCE